MILYDEQKTTVKEAFAALGIKFHAKNYAMGGYVSGPELAMCMESVFGSDIDILLWDFGMMVMLLFLLCSSNLLVTLLCNISFFINLLLHFFYLNK